MVLGARRVDEVELTHDRHPQRWRTSSIDFFCVHLFVPLGIQSLSE